MNNMNRREFLALSAKIAALIGLSASATSQVAEALAELSAGTAPVIWLQGQSCSGCSVSLLNASAPPVAEVITQYISLKFHGTLSVATGEVGMEVVRGMIKAGGYFLVAEGAVPAAMPEACSIGGEHYTEQLVAAAQRAKAVVAVGACAANGGIPAAANNPTGSMSVPAYLRKRSVSTPVISVPGCPAHPDWVVGTLVHVLKFGMPALDHNGRPEMFYGKKIHDQCPRFPDYEREKFAKTFGDDGCLFKLGCVGPNTGADCTLRAWNSGVNHCIKAGAPCIGCASEKFALNDSFGFYTKDRAKNVK